MLEALKFVMRGVAQKDYVPGLTHFRIQNGRCTGYNGALSISAPVDISFDVAPQAGMFIKALNACEGVITLKMETPDSLLVRSGNFRVSVPCIPPDSVPQIKPSGVMVAPHSSILHAFSGLLPFVGVDASRPWAMGILLAGESAYATNNVIVTEYWLGSKFPAFVNIPSGIVEELVRIDEELCFMQVAENSITFHYKDGRWVNSSLLALSWPNIPNLFQQCWQDVQLSDVTPELQEACLKLTSFVDKDLGHLYFRGTDISTTKGGIADGGAIIEMPGLPERGCYHVKHLNKVLEAADEADFSKYPEAVPFIGNNIRGMMLGIKS